jgi:hypothetical protein
MTSDLSAWEPYMSRAARLRKLEVQRDSPSIAVRFERACLLTQVGRTADAQAAYLELLALEPSHAGALNNLGSLLHETGYRTAARTAYAEAVARHPGDPMGHVNLANVLGENGDLEHARAHYETALRLQPDHAEAHRRLAGILAETGDREGAGRHRRLGFAGRALLTLPYRGERPPVPLLLLAGSAGGNIPLRHLLDDRIFQTYVIFPEFFDAATPLPQHSLVFNSIGDADLAAPALAAAQALLARTSAPVINAPAAVEATGRGESTRRLAGIPGVVMPDAVTLPRAVLTGPDTSRTLARHGFEFPLLIRTPGYHTGRHFLRVDTRGDLPGALVELPGDELTVLRYLDARGADGKARKYRVMMIDGRLYPLHLAISANWKIHYFTAEMANNPEHRAEDAAFLEDMPAVLGPVAMKALVAIQSRLGLDYGGIDFGLNAGRQILFFEANATMVVNPADPDPKWAYRRPAVEGIHAAVRHMLMARL